MWGLNCKRKYEIFKATPQNSRHASCLHNVPSYCPRILADTGKCSPGFSDKLTRIPTAQSAHRNYVKRYEGHLRDLREKRPDSLRFRGIRAFFRRPGVLAGALCLCLLLGYFLGSFRARSHSAAVSVAARAPAEEVRSAGPALVDLNTADEETLRTLPGIGPALAARIVAYREEHGGFQYLYELTNVKGIGISTYEALQELITLDTEE